MNPFIQWSMVGLLLISAGCATKSEMPNAVSSPLEVSSVQHTRELAMLHTRQGVLLFRQKDPEGAIREFREAIRLNPNSPVTHNNMAMTLHLLGKFLEAQAEFLIAIELDPSYAAAWSNLGFVLFEHGDTAPAIHRWKSAVKLDPRMPSAWGGLAIGLFAVGYVDQAAQSYRQALELDSRYTDVRYLHQNLLWRSRAIKHAGLLLDLLKSEAYTMHHNELRI